MKSSALNIKQESNVRYGTRVFTKQGVETYPTVIRTDVETKVSIDIMRTIKKTCIKYVKHKL